MACATWRRRSCWPAASSTSCCGSTCYRDVPDSVIGPAFLLNVIASVVVAVALAVSDHVLVLVAGLLVVDGTLLAFALSRTGLGFLGFEERGFEPSPEAALTLVFEIAAAVVLLWLLWRRLTDEDRASVVVADVPAQPASASGGVIAQRMARVTASPAPRTTVASAIGSHGSRSGQRAQRGSSDTAAPAIGT